MDDGLTIDVRHRLSRLRLEARLELAGETVGLVGPSGTGKTSFLRAVAGLLTPDGGRIVHGSRTLLDTDRRVNLPPEDRRVGLVFQDGALFPHMSVGANVAYGMRRWGSRRTGNGPAVDGLLERFGIAALRHARPEELSGGERQRVALARAVAAGPDILLLDEPLSGLDAVSRGRVATELAVHLRDLGLPTILVSHSFPDVVGLAARIAVMEEGRIVQEGTAAALVQAPVSPFVAALTGVNYFSGVGHLRGGLTEVTTIEGATLLSTDAGAGRVGVVVHPWDVAVSLSHPGGSSLNALSGPVERIAAVGNRLRLTVGSTPAIVAEITEESARHLGLAVGVSVVATWKATGTRLVPRS